MDWAETLPVIWAGVAILAVVMYVLLDGFDLGVGILFPFAHSDEERDVMMNSVAPIWDGNETWLVLGGAGLFGAFPLAYATILPATYLPLLLMLVALIFRGVAFEFRFKARAGRRWWDRSFHYGALCATIAQGLVLGAFIQGFAVEGRRFVGGPFDWLTPFSLMCAVALVAGYALLGATWLIWRTEGPLHTRCRAWAGPLFLAVLVFVGTVSIWTPLQEPQIAERWFRGPLAPYLPVVPLATAALGLLFWWSLNAGRDALPFVLALGMFLISFFGLGISLWPNAVPPDITIWEAAAPPESQGFLLIGLAALLPIVLGYTVFTYWVFRGKIRPGEGYGH
jgi:cytochrome d ubiquinol oxidase subunit II